MTASLGSLNRQIEQLRRQASTPTVSPYAQYQADPAGYAHDVLKVRWWHKQREIAESLLTPPYRTLVPSGHDVGKTHVGGGLVNWWFDTFSPSVVLTTAPKLESVRDLLWKEVRSQRRGRPGFPGPKSLRLDGGSPKHFAKGLTASSAAGFQGQHESHVLIMLDEAEGVEEPYWTSAKTMASGEGHAIVAFYNPTSQGSWAAVEEKAVDIDGKPSWRIIRLSALDHPNITAELAGLPPPIPEAVRLAKVEGWVQDWCARIEAPGAPDDFEWRPGSGNWYRPGPLFYCRVWGRRPPTGVDAVWSEAVFEAAVARELPLKGQLQIGCDVARFGDDFTCFHVRIGGASIAHESVNGWSTVQTANRLKQLATEHCKRVNLHAFKVPLAVDDCGVGGGVVDILASEGWNVTGVNVSEVAPDPDAYPNLRSALWFGLAEAAGDGNVSFARLPQGVLQDLRRELLAPVYELDVRGRRVVESKDDTKARIKRSPDNADAVMLAYTAVGMVGERLAGRVEVPT